MMATHIGEALVAKLRAHAGVTAIVGKRIQERRSTQRYSGPRITYFQVDRPTADHLKGTALPHPRFQFNLWGETPTQVKDLAVQVRDCFKPFRGDLSGFNVDSLKIVDERDVGDDRDDGSDKLDFGVEIDVVVWFEESKSL